MAVPAGQKFPQSIQRDSAELVVRIGRTRLWLAESRDRTRRLELPPGEARRTEALYRAMIRDAA